MEKIVIKKSQNSLLRPLGWFLRRFHLMLFFVFIVGCLSASVVLINKTLTESSSEDYTSSMRAGYIDDETLQQIQTLHTSTNQPAPTPLPEGRSNPFGE